MARPKGTYVSQVFNFGVDKTIPFGFVDLVFNRNGSTVGFEKDGKFYNLGEKVPAPSKKALTSDQLDKKKNLLINKSNILERQASNTNIGESERNGYIVEFGKTQDELATTEQSFVETQIREGKIKESQAKKKVAETIRFDLARLDERKNLLAKLGKSTFEVENVIKQKKSTLTSIQTKGSLSSISAVSGPDAARQGLPSSVLPASSATNTTPSSPVLPTSTPIVPPVKPPIEKVETPADREATALNTAAEKDLALPETLFKNIPSLNTILKKYVNTPGMTADAFRKALRDDIWYKQNSDEIKARFVQYYNYRDLQASGRAQGTTDYEMQIDKIEASLKKRATTLGSAAASDPAALRKAAENLYITNRSKDESFITDFLAASIRPISGMIGGKGTEGYSGEALTNYQSLLSTARDNGLKISDIIPGGSNEQQVLQNIISGKIDINRIISDTRKLAAQGQPQYVRDLLSQGYNLKQVYAPYRQTMAAVLEIDDPNSIDLNDPLLRSSISEKGDMNIYDFTRSLRKDNRWQYTKTAKDEVSTAALGVLRDFGFQG